ncbi:tRNA threonylcarbamoyladenosine biosynthesis protein TsaE [Ekhidna lutea]|uniref:tRNA threonylcarbamoyladenosine biosynthesis protein TsaE n=1 Tax=Ekhidna lutea TaxID=447679 RepID=A0A239L647_EKHLU|nr:tRNA (adenosine(37)-N6)-threonylcarbamoyltransferase complex ATPase subunit type 1 TsaE [Ekhidna lutea]SNT26086.1 tRNA threonylcarbamoyladenosine biosynthesis protein TsaE [Ekhidna lutea]
MTIPNYNEEELQEVARKLISNFGHLKVWCFDAEMGAGKTTLTKAICRELGVQDEMSSPTFSIVNEYLTDKNQDIYHFDFYRLKDMEEAMDIGVEDYLFSGNLCLLEWPQIIEPLLPDEYLQINIKLVGDNTRSLTAQPK